MPSASTEPAAGNSVIASAQVLFRKRLMIRNDFSGFGPTGPPLVASTQGSEIRAKTTIPANNLQGVSISLFLYPEIEEGGIVYPARNNLTWRPVYRMPPYGDVSAIATASFLPEQPGVVTNSWIPMSGPMVLPVGLPITFKCHPCGAAEIAIEMEASGAGAVTRIETVVVSMSASQ